LTSAMISDPGSLVIPLHGQAWKYRTRFNHAAGSCPI
jgi:hypothetical protein